MIPVIRKEKNDKENYVFMFGFPMKNFKKKLNINKIRKIIIKNKNFYDLLLNHEQKTCYLNITTFILMVVVAQTRF